MVAEIRRPSRNRGMLYKRASGLGDAKGKQCFPVCTLSDINFGDFRIMSGELGGSRV